MTLRHKILALVACAAMVAGAPRRALAQAGSVTDVIVGRVIDTHSAPVAQASVSATSIATGLSRTALTGPDGRYQIVFADGGGRYTLRVRKLGFVERTLTVTRGAESDRITADVTLTEGVTTLEKVVVSAPDSSKAGAAGTGRTVTQDKVARLPVDNAGDLAAIAALTPGVVAHPGTDTTTATFSVGGQRPTQNHVTLDGLTFAAGKVPRDALRSTRVITSTYDIAKGQFSGGEIASSTKSGTNTTTTSLTYDLQSDAMQVGAAPNPAFSREYSLDRVSGSAGGALIKDRLFAFGATEISRKVNPIATLLVSDPLTDGRLGINSDTVARFLNTVTALGIPLQPNDIPDDQSLDQASLLGRVDFVANDANHLTIRGDFAGSHGLGFRGSPRGLLQNLGRSSRHNSGLLAGLTTEAGAITNDLRATLQISSRNENGYVDLPRGRVFITSPTPDGALSTYDASVGGNQDYPAISKSLLVEAGDEIAWLSPGGAHRIKAGFLVNRGSGQNDVTEEKNGVFFFNSLADLANGTPASFTRVLSASLRSSSRSGAALYTGDAWVPKSGLEIDYGVRLEGSQYGSAPDLNPAVISTFGLHTDRYPSEVHLSPRIGFTYSANGDADDEGGLRLRGGIGEFRGVIPDANFANAAQSTGLPSGQTRLTCTGASVPKPNWQAYLANPANIPTACVGPATPTASTLPSVIAFTGDVGAPRTRRTSLGVTRRLIGPFIAAVDLFYIEGVSQLGIPDVNLNTTPQFTLANEAGRPIYVPVSSIDPATGAVSINDSRLHPAFGEVSQVESNLRSRTRQATVSISGETRRGLGIDASYTYTNARDQSLGYEGEGPDDNAFGNPNIPVWGRADEERRHSFESSVTLPLAKRFEFAFVGRLESGAPFAARLATDINGDGQRNDRAFVFDPNSPTTDTAVASGMRQLLATGTSTARDCLPQQFGQPAERNGCSGPWVPGFDLKLTYTAPVSFARKFTVSLTALNTLVGIDELVHGQNNIAGWGQDASIDQRLLFVTGFDPVKQQFTYRVNQHFGAAAGALNPFRIPFVLSLQGKVTLGGKGN